MNNFQSSLKILRNGFFALMFTLFAHQAFAHAGLENSIPAANANLKVTPPELVLNYESPVMLMNLMLNNSVGHVIELNFKASSHLEKTHKLPLPTLPQGIYKLNWAAMGKDGHNVKGAFTFTIAAEH